MKLSDRIKKYRKENNLTQKELASILYVSRSAVAKWEQERGFPDKGTLSSLSKLFNVSEDELISQKEISYLALKSAEKINKQNRSTIIIFIILSLICITLSVFLFFSLSMRDKAAPITETEYAYIDIKDNLATFYFYNNAYEKQSLTLGDGNLNAISLQNPIPCFDRWGMQVDISSLKPNYSVKITFSYLPNSKDVTIDKIEIIDDYVEGEYQIKGFFLSTEEYNGNIVPIYNEKKGYTDYKPNKLPGTNGYYEYYLNGSYYTPQFRYPYVLCEDLEFFSAGAISFISPIPKKIENPANNLYFEYVYNLPITLASEVESLYLYAIDNSAKGFSYYGSTTCDKKFSITCLSYKSLSSGDNNIKYAKSQYLTFNLDIVFNKNVEYVHIQEFDINHNVIKTTLLEMCEEINDKYYLQEKTYYVIVTQNKNSSGIFIKGNTINLSLSSKYGFIYTNQSILLV